MHEKVHGGCLYIVNGDTLVNDLRKGRGLPGRNYSRISGSNARYNEADVNHNVLILTCVDYDKNKHGVGRLTLQPGAPLKLRWQITRMSEHVVVYDREGNEIGSRPLPGWSVPEDVILTKISDTIPPIEGAWTVEPV